MSLNHRQYRWLGIILVILGACIVLVWGIRIYTAVAVLKSNLQFIRESLTVDNPLTIDPDFVTSMITSSRVNVLSLKRDTAFLIKFTPWLSWLPKVGPLLGELPDLLTFADLGTQTATQLWNYAQPTLVNIQQTGIEISVLTDLITAMSPAIDSLQDAAQHLVAVYHEIDPEVIPWRYQDMFRQVGPVLSLYDSGLVIIDDIPQLIGVGEPSTFLVLALNEDELRAGGGFISGVGELVLRDGKIGSMEFRDSYQADDYSLPYPDSPLPFQQFMAIDLWVFRDSNWSPDFPTSARQALSVYRSGTQITPTGVIALDQYAAEKIIDVVGPLHIPGSDTVVTGETLVEYMRNAWAPNNAKFQMGTGIDRKSFLGDITKATLKRVESGAVDWTSLLNTGIQLIEQRHIQIFIDNVDVAEFLHEQKWDSRIVFPSQDMFLFVDANVGYNKVSTRIERTLTYTVDLTQSPPIAEITLRMHHRSQNPTDCTPEVLVYPNYAQSMERCYWSYLRFFVPEGAQLLDATEHPIDASKVLTGQTWSGKVKISLAEEGGAVVFEQALLLPTASTTEIRLKYNLPDHVIQILDENMLVYKLVLQKQAGLRTISTQVILRVPQNALISMVHPESQNNEPGVFVYNVNLQQNTEFELRYSVPVKEGP